MQATVYAAPADQQERHGDAIGPANRARASRRRSRSRAMPSADGPRALGARPARDAGAGRCGDDVVDRNPGEVRRVEEQGDQARAPPAERCARGDDRRHTEPGTERGQSGDERRPEEAAAPISTRAVVRLKAGASAAPTCRVVATMLAPAKMRKRSKGDCVRSLGATGPMLAVCIRSARLYHSENGRLTH